MESLTACPGDALAVITEALTVADEVRDMITTALGAVTRSSCAGGEVLILAGSLMNLSDALDRHTALLGQAVKVTGDVIGPAFEAGREHEREAQGQRRGGRLRLA